MSDGTLELGGLEGVGNYTGADTIDIPLDKGRYTTVVYLVDWQAEPGSQDPNGKPTSNALPDFIVEISPELPTGATYRTSVATFDRP